MKNSVQIKKPKDHTRVVCAIWKWLLYTVKYPQRFFSYVHKVQWG